MKRLLLLLMWLLALPIGMLAQGTTWQTATTINSGETKEGSLYATDDYQRNDEWYKIVVPEEGTAEFTLTPGGNLNIHWIQLYRVEDGETVDRNFSYIGTEEKTVSITDIGKGTYYLQVRRYSGGNSYTIKYNFTACPIKNDPEPNNEWNQGSTLESGKTIDCRLGYTDDTGLTDNDDWFKFEVPEEGKIDLTFDPTQGIGLNIHWISICRVENGQLVERNFSYIGTAEKTVTITDLGIGTFYMRVHRYSGHGGYKLRYVYTRVDFVGDEEPNDEWSEDCALLKNGETIECKLGYQDANGVTDNDDWFKIIVPQEGKVEFTFNPNQENGLNIHWMTLYRVENGEPKNRNFSYIGTEEKMVPITDLGIGTYYLQVHRYGGHGGYTLKYQFTPCPLGNDAEPNDEWNKGSLLISGEPIECRLGYTDDTDLTDNDDWFRIEVPEEGKGEFTFDPSQEFGLNIHWMTLYRIEDGEVKDRNFSYIGTEKKTVEISDLGIGTFYLQVRRYGGHGGYTLNYQFTPNPYIGDVEPNNSYENAQTLVKGEKVMAHLGYTDDTGTTDNDDWYKFDIDIIGTPSLAITPNQTYGLNIHWIQVYSLQDGELKELKFNYIGTNPTSIYLPYYEKGTYYVQVRRYGGHGDYSILFDEEPIRYYDDEPNDEVSQAVIIHDGETKVGNIGFKKDEETYDINDWFKVNVDEGSQLMFSYDPDQGEGIDATLYLWYDNGGTMEPVTVKYNQGGLKSGTSAWAHLQSLNIMTDENMKGGTYYLNLHRNNNGGMGTYTMTFSTMRRTLGSEIRVNYIGWPSVRKGVPGSFDVTLENTGSMPTAPFLLCIPYTEDIKLLYANLPDNLGGQRIDVSDMGDEQYHNAIFVFPGMNPYEKYTFTVWAEGYVEGTYDARATAKIQPTPVSLTVLGLMAVNFITDGTNNPSEDNLKDGFVNYVKSYAQEKDVLEEFARAYSVAENDLRDKKSTSKVFAQGFTTIIQKASESVNTGLEYAETVKGALEYLKTIACPLRSIYMAKFGIIDECSDTPVNIEILDEEIGANNIVASWDPNEMVGPVGYGDENYIGETQTINYRILFENKAEAGAPAYRIRITDVLDENVFDVNSVRFGETSHDAGTGWKMTRDGNTLSWSIEGIELPPNVNAPEGEGYVTFSVNLKPGLANKTFIKNKATIIFDKNDPIETNEYVNTLDLAAPTTKMVSAKYNGNKVTVTCSGTDNESGISRYKFYVCEKDGEPQLFAEEYKSKAVFTIPDDGKVEEYTFFALAVDNVSNIQETPPAAIVAEAIGSGDVDGDGNTTAADVVAIVKYLAGNTAGISAEAADVNGDGVVDIADVITLVNILQGN